MAETWCRPMVNLTNGSFQIITLQGKANGMLVFKSSQQTHQRNLRTDYVITDMGWSRQRCNLENYAGITSHIHVNVDTGLKLQHTRPGILHICMIMQIFYFLKSNTPKIKVPQ